MKMIDNKLKSFIVNTLRKASQRWAPKNEALKRFRVPIGLFKNGNTRYGYRCNICNEKFMRKDIQIDHINPVVSTEGFTTFDDYIERMFCDADGFQTACFSCHDEKTNREKEDRKEYRKNNKR